VAAVIIGPPSAAASQTSCWRTLFVDYGDGQIEGTYSLGCYHALIARMAGERSTYGYAVADIPRILNRSVARLPAARRATLTPMTMIPPTVRPPQTAGPASSPTRRDVFRFALAGLLTVLLLAWVMARLRQQK
jgi:hypothetical protein